MLEKLRQIDWSSLKTILLFGLIIRLIAVVFSEGYGMHDDHFLVIEAAGSWADGFDYNHWLPWTVDNTGNPEGHSFTYVGLNFLLISFLKLLGIAEPKMIMLINRLIHAVFSLLVIKYGFKIAEKIADRKTAVTAAWLLAGLWAFPWLSVRNLVEMVSIPFLMWGVWLALKEGKSNLIFYSGILIGVAISFRYQIAVFAVGMGIWYLFKGQWQKLALFTLGTITTFLITQGLVDYFIWGYPFAEFIAYVIYNMNEGTGYLANSNYFMYFYVLFGVLLFPLGILALIGFFNSAKRQWFLFLPTFLFILFHSIFPNRQERFILTVLPIVIVLSVVGYNYLRTRTFWNKAWKFSWVAFWVLNIPMILLFSTAPSKKSRVNAMYAIYGKTKGDENILLEATGESSPELMPKFYAGKWNYSFSELKEDSIPLQSFDTLGKYDLIFFFGQKNLSGRIDEAKAIYPKMTKEAAVLPSFIDKTLNSINPRNSNTYIEIWKTHVD